MCQGEAIWLAAMTATPSTKVVVYWARRLDANHAWLTALDAVERARFGLYRRPEDRDRFLVGAALVRALGARHAGVSAHTVRVDRTCPHCAASHGPPTIVGCDIEASISHSGEVVVLAATLATRIGVDVERRPSPESVPDLARYALTPNETVETPAEFAEYWTRKESALKCTRDGLLISPIDIAVTAPHLPPALLTYPARPDMPGRMTLVTPTGVPPGYAASVALLDAVNPVIAEESGTALLASALRGHGHLPA